MRTLFIICALCLPSAAFAGSAHIGVNGLICAFCVSGIQKNMGKHEAVESVNVNMDEKIVHVEFKPDTTLDDGTLTSVIEDAGYTVTSINREE